MIKDFLISFTDNFREKTKNPFLGTYLLVWLVRNWELVYTLFNFDKDCNLDDKKAFVRDYYSSHSFIENLFSNIYWAFGLLVLTYLLLNLSRLIVNLSEKRVTPWIYKITDSKSIVLKSVYENLRAENDNLLEKLDKERDSKSRLETRMKTLENEITELLSNAKKKKTSEVSPEKNENDKRVEDEASILLRKLKEKEMLKDFVSTSISLNKGEYIAVSYKPTDLFIELGLIKYKDSSYSGSAKSYTITQIGEKVLRLARLE